MAAHTGSDPTMGTRTRLTGTMLADDASFLLARANAVAIGHASAELAGLGLKVRSYAVLALAASDDRPSQREIADILRLDPSQVVALVDDLERRGLVERLTDATDRRTNLVTATERGREAALAARDAVRAVDEQTYGALSAQERAVLIDLLSRIAFRGDTSD